MAWQKKKNITVKASLGFHTMIHIAPVRAVINDVINVINYVIISRNQALNNTMIN